MWPSEHNLIKTAKQYKVFCHINVLVLTITCRKYSPALNYLAKQFCIVLFNFNNSVIQMSNSTGARTRGNAARPPHPGPRPGAKLVPVGVLVTDSAVSCGELGAMGTGKGRPCRGVIPPERGTSSRKAPLHCPRSGRFAQRCHLPAMSLLFAALRSRNGHKSFFNLDGNRGVTEQRGQADKENPLGLKGICWDQHRSVFPPPPHESFLQTAPPSARPC